MSTLLLVDKRMKCDIWKGQAFQTPTVTVRIAVSKRSYVTGRNFRVTVIEARPGFGV
jgi:hypothetical protein